MSQTLQTPDAHRHALRVRVAKRAQAEAIGIDEDFVSDMVERFYASIREDELLGPIFAERIDEWPPHLSRMKQFWRSILHNSGDFSGNPMVKHIAIPGLTERHFSRWLELFYANLHQMNLDARAVQLVGDRARMIADSLLTGISVQRDGIGGAIERKDLPHV
ncbi:hemoglobin [Altererythrobacter xiamenensis]|uniref:Hemoglobin n=1 Tax=Altererythrobacter xiamenensis TaxID=1316679 RepID=A0A1Y6EQB2_9SPHN|nr:group III truncated hemoglobin [Altererythrobacter xiamenensis]SMQ64469.1 hemoglobin [Altererythrobacter xiamenensis]